MDGGSKTRTYFIHTPRRAKGPMPLLMMLHGYTDMPRLMEFYTRMSKKADKEGFMVVYPEGVNGNGKTGTAADGKGEMRRSWNAGFCCGVAHDYNVDDVSFLRALIDELKKNPLVDATRIYIAGFSNGGMMTHRMASELSDTFAAAAVVAGSIGSDTYTIPEPKNPVPIIMLNGAKDRTVLVAGGKNKDGYYYQSLAQAEAFWKRANKEAAPVVVKIYPDSGHRWFGGLQEPIKGLLHPETKATNVIWEFFKDKKRG